MQVQETVFKMMREFPTLYRTRVLALLTLFDASYTEWRDGELISLDISGEGRDSFLPYSAAEVANPVDEHKASDVVYYRGENAKAQFVHDNAYLLCRDTAGRMEKHAFLRFEGKRFADMPENVTEDWLDAAKELATAICRHKYWPDREYAETYVKQGMQDTAKSIKICEQFLERFKVITPCPYARAARVRELLREAQALGLQLSEADGSLPKTVV